MSFITTTRDDSLGCLAKEYSMLLSKITEDAAAKPGKEHVDILCDRLIAESEWTPRAAQHLARLARDYGTFMLRNALALAVAMEIEDGRLGF